MSNVKKSLDNIFGVENEIITKPTVIGSPQKAQAVPQEIQPYVHKTDEEYEQEDDFATARKNLQELTEKGKQALDGIISVAEDTDKPSAYEAAAVLIKTLADANKDLYDLHKKRKELQRKDDAIVPTGGVTIDKAVFVGTTAELLTKIENEIASKKNGKGKK